MFLDIDEPIVLVSLAGGGGPACYLHSVNPFIRLDYSIRFGLAVASPAAKHPHSRRALEQRRPGLDFSSACGIAPNQLVTTLYA